MNLDSIMKTSWGKLGAMTLVIFIMGIWMANLFFFGAMKKDLKSLRAELKNEEEKREPLADIVRSKQKFENILDNFWQTNDVKNLIQVINDTANQYPVNIVSLVPKANSKVDYFEAMGVQLMGTAKYHDLGKFVAAIESHFPKIYVQNASLTTAQNTQNDESLSFNISLQAYTPFSEDKGDVHAG